MAPSATSTDDNSKSTNRLDFTVFTNIINGKLVRTTNTRHGINPATKKPLAEVPIATEKDLDDAVSAARVAFKSWSKTHLSERKAALEAFAIALESYEAEFANMLTTEQGKPIRMATLEAKDGPLWI